MSDQKPYYSLNQYYYARFGSKTAKITIDGGFSCPNRNGRSDGGCRFCSSKGSGDFTQGAEMSIAGQIQLGKQRTVRKWPNAKYIAYFQAYTNTYAPVEELRAKYTEALEQPEICGIAIATRPDCLPSEVVCLLAEFSKQIPMWVELGLQTAHNKTAQEMNLGYTPNDFAHAVQALHQQGIESIAHVIFGLPNETFEDMLETVRFVNKMPVSGIKIQLLHVLRNTPLAKDYEQGLFQTMSQDEYINVVAEAIRILRPDIVIHRLTGDGGRNDLIAPLWSLEKSQTLNKLHHYLKKQGIRQGQDYKI